MLPEQPQKIVLVDGSSYLFRAYYGLPSLAHNGHATGAIYGVLNMLRKLVTDEKPDRVAVVFDAKGKTFRSDLYAEYKANRPPMPPDLREQIEPLHNIIRAQGLPLICIQGVEADDVIGTLSVAATQQGYQVLISTGDKDMAQLVNPNVRLTNTMNQQVLDEDGVMEKFRVRPDQIIDYLALMGDSADNIPGVAKVGPKTASKWIERYGSLQAVMQHADEITGKVGENLRAALDYLPLSYQLATIKLDCELGLAVDDLILTKADSNALATYYQDYGFTRWYEELGKQVAKAQPEVKVEYECVLTPAALDRWLTDLKNARCFAIDTETTGLDYMQAKLVGISFAIQPNHACYIPLRHHYPEVPEQLESNSVLNALKPILEDDHIGKIGQNIKYDAHILIGENIVLKGIQEDSMLQSYVLNSTESQHSMDALAHFYLGRDTIRFEAVAGKGAKQLTFDKVDLYKATDYAAEDADITLQLHLCLQERLLADKKLYSVYRDIELPLVEVLLKIEQNGVLVDQALLAQQGVEVARQLDALEALIFEQAGEVFNLSSPKQIQHIFFDKLQFPVLRKTAKGQPSTAEDVLEELAQNYQIPALMLEHRSLNKLKTTYIDKLPGEINPRTGRVHTSYQQAVASTGRLSSTRPNLQNIPIRTPQGRKIREAFIAEAGKCIVSLDYSQIELRIMSNLSADEGLGRAFALGLDVHRATAAEVFGCALEAVQEDQRRAAKAINFGLIYGMSAFGLGKQLHIGRFQAQKYVDSYFEHYPKVKQYMEETRQLARDQGYVETLFGRRLYLPDIHAKNAVRRQYAERTAINAPVQGTAADIIKRAMIDVHRWIIEDGDRVRMIMQVHDELVFEVDATDVERNLEQLSTLMVLAAAPTITLEVDAGVGASWREAH